MRVRRAPASRCFGLRRSVARFEVAPLMSLLMREYYWRVLSSRRYRAK